MFKRDRQLVIESRPLGENGDDLQTGGVGSNGTL